MNVYKFETFEKDYKALPYLTDLRGMSACVSLQIQLVYQ